MKTLFSLKVKIGAIFTAAALVSTALPMTGFAATASTAPELLVNGAFSSCTNEAFTVGEVHKVSIGANTIPDNWELHYNEAEYDTTSGTSQTFVFTGKTVLAMCGDAFSFTQKVKNIEPLTRYTLSFGAKTFQYAVAKVNFLNYDATTDTYKTIGEYVADYNAANEDQISLVSACIDAVSSAKDYTGVEVYIHGGSMPNNVPQERRLNFITPPYTNAVEVVLAADGDNAHPNQIIYYDNISLKRSAEVVNNGKFEDLQNSGYDTGWSKIHQSETLADGTQNGLFVVEGPGSTIYPQNQLLKVGQRYRVTFKYKHTLGETIANKDPNFAIVGAGADYTGIPFDPVAIGTDGDWTIYEGYFTAPEGKANPGSGLFNLNMLCRSRTLEAGEVWTTGDGQTMCYDNISIVEAPEMGVTSAGGAEIVYSPAYDGETVELIVAKYEPGTTNLVDIDRETIGADAKAGYVTKYVASLAASYDVKAFLWDGLGTMRPITSTITRESLVREVPYSNDFSSADDVARVSYQDISIREIGGSVDSNAFRTGTIGIEDGMLVQRNVTGYWFPTTPAFPQYLPRSVCGNGQLTIDFEPQSTGTLVLEVYRGYTADVAQDNRNMSGYDGVFGVYASDGTRIADIQADGRGDFGSPWEKTGWVAGTLDGNNWMYARTIKYEIDFTAKKYKVFFDDVQKTAGTQTEFEFTQSDASKLVYNFSQNGEAIDNIRIYKKITAEQAATAFELKVGETATAAITYTPATESMPDMTFTSSSPAVADVTANGLITARRAGTATITATSALYGKTLTWTVTVIDGRVVTPVALPYDSANAFATDGKEIADLEGWSVLNRLGSAVLETAGGKLVASGVTEKNGATGAVQAKLAFEPVPVVSGKLVIEVDYNGLTRDSNGYTIDGVAASEGILNLYSEAGVKMAGIRANGRGDFSVYDSGKDLVAFGGMGWQHGASLKLVLDMEAATYKVYRNGSEVVYEKGDFFIGSGDDISSLEFTFTNSNDFIEKVKVYVPEENPIA
ncbi:MAG: Ig-like domain-containing protein [Eubacteriales bacterium]|nr:Ig-like domain-containing protein [Eubacteriales bacterium]